MKQTIETKVNQFAANREEIKELQFLMDSRIAAASAALFTLKNQEASLVKLRAVKENLKSKVGLFSSFRGSIETPVICALSCEDDPETLLDKSLKAYKYLKAKFMFTDYLPVAAIMAAQSVPEERYEEIADRTRQIYNLIKQDHSILTGMEDELMCVILALQNKPVEQQAEAVEYCFRRLDGKFGTFASGDGVQSLSEVIAAAGGDMETNCGRAIDLYNCFKESGSSISNGYELGALGALAILPVSIEELKPQVLEVAEALKDQKGYGLLGMSRSTRMIHAALIVASEYAADENGVLAAIQGTISAIIMEEVMIISIIAASNAANASHSH